MALGQPRTSGTATENIEAIVQAAKIFDPDGNYSRKGTTLKYSDETPADKLGKDISVGYFEAYLEGKVNDMTKLKKNEEGTKYRYYDEGSNAEGKYEVEMTLAKD